jgi:hypothetical protein
MPPLFAVTVEANVAIASFERSALTQEVCYTRLGSATSGRITHAAKDGLASVVWASLWQRQKESDD